MKKKVMTFESVHHALGAEKAIRLAGIDARVINTPRRLSSDCGISITFDLQDEQQVIGAITEKGINFRGLYEFID